MPMHAEIYSAEQREALATAYEDRRIRPAAAVVELAARGELPDLEAFTTTESTVRDCASKLRRRRRGELTTALASQPPRDAVEALRRRLMSLCDRELAELERKKAGTVKIETLRQVTRVLRELAAIPGPDDPRPVQPGQRNPGTGAHNGAKTRGGLASALLAAHEGSARVETQGTQPAQSDPPPTTGYGDSVGTDNRASEHGETQTHEPGEWARAEVAAQQG